MTETVTHAPHRPLSRALPLSHAATPLAAFPTRAHPRQRLLAWIIGLLAAGCLKAHAGPLATPSHTAGKLLTPIHVAMLRSVSAAVISPDGKQVAYTLVVPRKPLDEEDGRAWSELHVVDAKGHSRPFVTGAVNVRHIRWTPDGRAISIQHGLASVRFRDSLSDPRELRADEIASVEVDMWSTAYEFAAGHRIAVLVSSAQFPAFDAHRNLFDNLATGTDWQLATQTVHVGGANPSRLVVHQLREPRRRHPGRRVGMKP